MQIHTRMMQASVRIHAPHTVNTMHANTRHRVSTPNLLRLGPPVLTILQMSGSLLSRLCHAVFVLRCTFIFFSLLLASSEFLLKPMQMGLRARSSHKCAFGLNRSCAFHHPIGNGTDLQFFFI